MSEEKNHIMPKVVSSRQRFEKISIPTSRRVVGGPTLSGLCQYVLTCISDDAGNLAVFWV